MKLSVTIITALLLTSMCYTAASETSHAVTSSSSVQTQQYESQKAVYTLAAEKITNPITVVTRVQFPQAGGSDAVDTIWLAGFSLTNGGAPANLTVSWKKDGWFNQWRLGLETTLNIIPPEVDVESGSTADSQIVYLQNTAPIEQHIYEATLSYDPENGHFALGVVDVTTQEQYYAGVVKLKPVHQPLYAGTGWLRTPGSTTTAAVTASSSASSGPISAELVRVNAGLVPAGVQWRLLEEHKPGEWLPVSHVDRRHNIALEVKTGIDATLPGRLRFLLDHGQQREELVVLSPIQGQSVLPIKSGAFPAGATRLVMEYVQEDEVKYSTTLTLSTGIVQISLAGLVSNVESGIVNGAFVVTGDGEIPNVKISSDIRIERKNLLPYPQASLGSETTPVAQANGGALTSIVVEAAIDATSTPQQVPLHFPISDQPQLWKVSMMPKVGVSPVIKVAMDIPSSKVVIAAKDGALKEILNMVRKQFSQEFLVTGVLSYSMLPLAANGSWADVDYTHQGIDGWRPQVHLDRLLKMAQAYRHPGNEVYGSESLRKEIAAGLAFWVDKKLRSPNWWYNEILVPQRLCDILLLMEDDIASNLRQATLNLIRPEIARLSTRETAGENLVWNEANKIRLGLLENDLAVISSAFESMASELRLVSTNAEGIQKDYSFHQHGRLLYSGGYGAGFAADLSRFAYIARGTNLFAPEALQVLVDYILEGQQWMVRNKTFDFSAVGREIGRGHASGNANYLVTVCQRLLTMPGIPRSEELRTFLARLQGSGKALRGNRYFFTSEFMTHQRDNYYVSLKAASSRTVASEIGNEENLKGFHLGDGVMYIMQSGTEYDGIFPVWDWERLPGTTTVQATHTVDLKGWKVIQGPAIVSGGASNGLYGAVGMHQATTDLTAKKAWFFFDREVVALGTDITAKADGSVLTSVNQTRSLGEIYAAIPAGTRTLEWGQQVLNGPGWVHHNGVGYVLPHQGQVTVANQLQIGSWYDLNHTMGKNSEITPVFSLWFDHGLHPVQAQYEYIVVPGITRQELALYADNNDIRILNNSPEMQAVWHEQLHQLQVVFWKAGKVTTPAGLTVAADKPAILLVAEHNNQVEITASTLDTRTLDLRVQIATQLHGQTHTADSKFTFPGGDYTGNSLVQTVQLAQE